MENNTNPFKGLYSYEEKDQNDFSGRYLDVMKLFNLVRANNNTMVYGQSGIGKTSLLHAGLFPMLRASYFLPVSIRLNYLSLIPLKNQIIQRVQEEWNNSDISKSEKESELLIESFRKDETLWEFFCQVGYVDVDGKQWTPVLVFDQFEEIFTIGKTHQEREALAEELYYLVENQLPDSSRQRFFVDGSISPCINTEMKFRIVLGLREDYLPHMDWLRERIPSLFRVTFRVLPLNGAQARSVMSNYPGFQNANIQDDILRHFNPSDISTEQKIADENLEIEPPILSLLCYRMVEKRISALSIKEKDNIIADFYDEELKKISNSRQLAEFIESHLLAEGGFRTPFYLASNHPLRDAVNEAVNRRILRKVYYGQREYVEIIHDVLVPIIKERKKHREAQLRRRQIFYQSVAVVGLLFILLGIYAFIQKNRADMQYQKALSNGLAAQSSLELPEDNIKAIRLAEEAYKIGQPQPSPSVQQVLTTAAYSTYDRPFYTAIKQYENNVETVAYSPGATKILTLSLGGHAKLFDLAGKLLTDFSKHPIKINTGLFSPDGNYLITLSMDNMARFWDLKGNLLAELNKHTNKVWGAVFAPDSSKILTFSDDKTAKLWDLNGRLLADLNKHTGRVSSASFSPNSSMIVTTSYDKTAKLWNLNGTLLADLRGHTDYIWNAGFSFDGTKVLTASIDKTVKVWDLSGKQLHDLKFTDKVRSAALSPDGTTLLVRVGNTAELCDLEGNIIADLKRHKSDVSDALLSPNGKILTCSGNSADLWDLKGNHLDTLDQQTDYISKAMFYNNDTGILTCAGNTVTLWDLNKSFVVDLNNSMGTVRNAIFSPGMTKIITWTADNAKLFDLKGNLLAELKQHKAPILSVAFSPDNGKILTGSWDNTAKLWDLKGNLITDFNKHPAQVSAVAFMPGGSKILTIAQHNSAAIWDLQGNLQAKLNINMDMVEKAILSPDGSMLLTWFSGGNWAQLWDMKGKLLAELKGHTDLIINAAFFPDGNKIMTAAKDNTIRLWDLRGDLLTDIKRQISPLTGAYLSPNGDRIITTSEDNTAKLLDLEGNLLADLNKNNAPISSAAFIDNGKRILTISKDGVLKSWHTPEAIIEDLKTSAIPQLTKEDKENLGISGEW